MHCIARHMARQLTPRGLQRAFSHGKCRRESRHVQRLGWCMVIYIVGKVELRSRGEGDLSSVSLRLREMDCQMQPPSRVAKLHRRKQCRGPWGKRCRGSFFLQTVKRSIDERVPDKVEEMQTRCFSSSTAFDWSGAVLAIEPWTRLSLQVTGGESLSRSLHHVTDRRRCNLNFAQNSLIHVLTT